MVSLKISQGEKIMKKIAALIMTMSLVCSAATVYVDAGASGTNDGTSWTNAYTSLSTAISSSTAGDSVWVKAGTYKPGSGRNETFTVNKTLNLYGGFDGTETMEAQRNPSSNPTILSGDIHGVAQWICDSMEDTYYSTQLTKHRFVEDVLLDELIEQFKDKFVPCKEGYVFGTVAVRRGQGFVTTVRGKKSLGEQTYVTNVDHKNRIIHVVGDNKATLNAPLLSHVFDTFADVDSIVHYHKEEPNLETYPYAHPGTVKDSIRPLSGKSFNIKDHGCFLLLDKSRRIL